VSLNPSTSAPWGHPTTWSYHPSGPRSGKALTTARESGIEEEDERRDEMRLDEARLR
jgi:hypothetical protein